MDPLIIAAIVFAGILLNFLGEYAMHRMRSARLSGMTQGVELKEYKPVTDRYLKQEEDETIHVTLANERVGEDFEYKVARWWNTETLIVDGKNNNNEHIDKLLEDGWEPFGVGGGTPGKWGKTDIIISTILLRRPKVKPQ